MKGGEVPPEQVGVLICSAFLQSTLAPAQGRNLRRFHQPSGTSAQTLPRSIDRGSALVGHPPVAQNPQFRCLATGTVAPPGLSVQRVSPSARALARKSALVSAGTTNGEPCLAPRVPVVSGGNRFACAGEVSADVRAVVLKPCPIGLENLVDPVGEADVVAPFVAELKLRVAAK